MGADESEDLRGVVDAMDLQPAVFDSLAVVPDRHLNHPIGAAEGGLSEKRR